jgi:hypothetical protein
MTSQEPPVCPKCGQNDRVEKVSTIYLQGIGAHKTPVNPQVGSAASHLSKREAAKLRKLLAPPMSGKKELVRPIHPDLMVLVLTGMLPIFLDGIARSQRGMLLPVLAVVLVFYVFYFWMRKRLVGRYHQQKQSLLEEKGRVEKAVGRWMKAFYCGRDEVLFREGVNEWVPGDQIDQLIWKE